MKASLNRFTVQECGYSYEMVPVEVLDELIAYALLLATCTYTKKLIPSHDAGAYLTKAIKDLQETAIEFLNNAEIIEFDPKTLN